MIFGIIKNTKNWGDLACCPKDYFNLDGEKQDIYHISDFSEPIILGGGGLLHNTISNTIKTITEKKQSKLILWGAGINIHGQQTVTYPDFLTAFDFLGLRDWNNPYSYVPCVSCMHPSFNNKMIPEFDYVVYEHYDYSINIDGSKRSNIKDDNENFEDIIKFLQRGETIITNSYHGAYWGLLLGRKILIWEPFSNKFFGFKPPTTYCNRNNWKSMLKNVKNSHFNYLEECRELNIIFLKTISFLL